jgi:hypothetical protein
LARRLVGVLKRGADVKTTPPQPKLTAMKIERIKKAPLQRYNSFF